MFIQPTSLTPFPTPATVQPEHPAVDGAHDEPGAEDVVGPVGEPDDDLVPVAAVQPGVDGDGDGVQGDHTAPHSVRQRQVAPLKQS